MIIFPHLLIGAAIGSQFNNPWIIFIFALSSHFLADRIPHWEYDVRVLKGTNQKGLTIFLFKLTADIGLGGLLLILLLWRENTWLYALFGAFISALPDLPLFIGHFFPRAKIWTFYKKLHEANHLPEKYCHGTFIPLLSELAVAALAIFLIRLR